MDVYVRQITHLDVPFHMAEETADELDLVRGEARRLVVCHIVFSPPSSCLDSMYLPLLTSVDPVSWLGCGAERKRGGKSCD